jgi:murein DD-endopeptidase MepM/ murein hydrolase activator NlpD
LLKYIFFVSILISSLFAKVNIDISHKNIIKGTTFAVVLQSNKKLKKAPNVVFKNKTYQMFSIKGKISSYEVFLPVDYHNKIQKENIQVKYIQDNKIIKKNIAIDITKGNYKQNEIIKVSKSKVILSKKDKQRNKKEYSKVFKNVYSVINPKNLIFNSNFQNPIKSKITSAYGNARVYNGKTKSYHSGVDFRAKVGTKIYASNDGVVALSMDRFYLGKVVYIDHGRGAYSYYCHLSKINVKKNQLIKKGQLIGLSGKSGRVTAPHLHYAMRLYNVTVSPLQYGKLYNNIVAKYHLIQN